MNNESKKENNVLDELVSGLRNVEKLKEQSLSEKFANDNADSINWEDLINAEFEKWIVLKGKGVRFKRVFHPKKECYFITEMNPELSEKEFAEFALQLHDCKEIGEVFEGHMIEMTENNKEYKKNDIFMFPKNHKHKPISYLFSRYGVEFFNPKKLEN